MYQEQSWLLDPHLEGLVLPVVSRLKEEISRWMESGQTEIPYHSTLSDFSFLLYQYIKCRGHKMIGMSTMIVFYRTVNVNVEQCDSSRMRSAT